MKIYYSLAILGLLILSGCSSEATEKDGHEVEVVEEKISDESVEVINDETESQEEEAIEVTEIEEVIEEKNDVVMAGDKGIINKDVLFALGESKNNLDEMFNYITAQNSDAVDQMIMEGKVAVLSVNTAVTVMESDLMTFKVRVNETGEIGWLPYEYVDKAE